VDKFLEYKVSLLIALEISDTEYVLEGRKVTVKVPGYEDVAGRGESEDGAGAEGIVSECLRRALHIAEYLLDRPAVRH
jgi:hypothetical protein